MSASATPLTADQPWRGAEPYTEADRAFFYGRRREVEELRLLLQRDAIALLTGGTELGKTSLVRAGLLPSLSPDWLPVPLVLDWAAANDQRPLTRQVLEAIEAAAQARTIDGPKSNATDTLWEAFHRSGSRWWNARQRAVTPILVLDQFENAFTAGAANATAQRHRDRFLEELSQLVANRPPSRVASRIEDGTEKEDAFDFGPVPIRVVLVMREAALPELITLRPLFPTLEHSELRLTAFTEAQARDVLVRAGSQRGLFAEGVVDQLLPRIAAGNDREHPFAPAALSIQARALAEHRTKRNAAQITSDFLAPTQPAPAVRTPPPTAPLAPAQAGSPPAAPVPVRRNSAAAVPLLLLLFAAVGVTLWQQQELRNEVDTMKTRAVPSAPLVAKATPLPEPEPTPEPPPRIVIAEATPVPVPATPAPPTPMPATPAPALSIAVATPTPLQSATPMPEFTPENGATTAIVPAGPAPTPPTPVPTPTPAPATPAPEAAAPSIPAPPSARPVRKAPDAARRERERERAEPPRRPATTTIVPQTAPPPPRATPRKPAFSPGSGN